KLPVIFVVENNGYALSTPTADAIPVENIVDSAVGYGMAGEIVDGNDLSAVIASVGRAAERGRRGAGPTLLEMKTFRMRGHEEASGTSYVPEERFAEWRLRDPIRLFEEKLLEEGSESAADLEAVRKEIAREVDEAAEYAIRRADVSSTLEAELADRWAPSPGITRRPGSATSEKRFIDAISDGLRDALEADENVLVLGQDVAEYGGVFKVMKGFVEQFGKDRIRNTPIIESGAVGACMGLAIEGYKPVLEIQYSDFITCGFNQIVNNLATTHYRWGQPLNVTIRAPIGGNIGAGPFHSQSMEAWFCHVPGLKVVYPSTPEDAKGLLMSAINDPNPILFFEQKYLYRALKGEVPDGPYEIELGKARIARQGRDATIVTYGLGLQWALQEAERLAVEGVAIEIVDLRTLVPWDRNTILTSLAKTNRLLVLYEAPRTGGFGGEIAAQIAEEGFELLDAPLVRVAAEDLPVPFSVSLERELYSAGSKLSGALKNLLQY
ncbi:MAG: thiamine pyrophosphate-dependent enzyme, partial [Rhodothermales bacterium]